jgi:hypothetical protein
MVECGVAINCAIVFDHVVLNKVFAIPSFSKGKRVSFLMG